MSTHKQLPEFDPELAPENRIEWHNVGDCGKLFLWGQDLGDNTVVKRPHGTSFIPPKDTTFAADALRVIADLLEAEDKS